MLNIFNLQFIHKIASKQYDYIIGGAGLAGLTLAYKMMKAGLFDTKQLLIIDPDQKEDNDRTWSFWAEDIKSITDFPVTKKWNYGIVKTQSRTIRQSLSPYQYYSIEGLAYYQFIKKALKENNHITWLVANIEDENIDRNEIITTIGKINYTDYYFKSHFKPKEIINPSQIKPTNFMWQHFLGWKVKVKTDLFDADAITYMDMCIEQPDNGLAFIYILPESSNEALVEYTLFSNKLLSKDSYESTLKGYLTEQLGLNSYETIVEEYNKIPMTTLLNEPIQGSCIPIGTIAGAVKASTGYSFVRNHEHINTIVKALVKGQNPPAFKQSNRHHLYDKVLLDVIGGGAASGETIFSSLYHQNKLNELLKFLDEKTNLWEEIKIMNSVPKWTFIKGVVRNLF